MSVIQGARCNAGNVNEDHLDIIIIRYLLRVSSATESWGWLLLIKNADHLDKTSRPGQWCDTVEWVYGQTKRPKYMLFFPP